MTDLAALADRLDNYVTPSRADLREIAAQLRVAAEEAVVTQERGRWLE